MAHCPGAFIGQSRQTPPRIAAATTPRHVKVLALPTRTPASFVWSTSYMDQSATHAASMLFGISDDGSFALCLISKPKPLATRFVMVAD